MARIDRWQDRDNAALSPLKLYGNSTIVFKKIKEIFILYTTRDCYTDTVTTRTKISVIYRHGAKRQIQQMAYILGLVGKHTVAIIM